MICIFLGTRPEIIKMSPIIRELIRDHIGFYIVHTNQHYSDNMDKKFFIELELPEPKYNLHLESRTHGSMLAEIIKKAEQVFIKERPTIVLVEGDTNSVLGGAIAAWKMGIKIGHVEAGLRSYDRSMPEELNRKLTDHISDLLFCPTKNQEQILISENIDNEKIFVTGNTIVDSTINNLKISIKKFRNIEKEKYILMTLHRPSNVDDPKTFKKIIHAVEKLSKETRMKVVFPIHPRTKKMANKFHIIFKNEVFNEKPSVGYLEMLSLEKNARLILTDSGGVQEEACVLKVPCVTLRNNTERPETIDVGANIIAGVSEGEILKSAFYMLNKENIWINPFGNGKAGTRILRILQQKKLI